jgi:hypothetical protein
VYLPLISNPSGAEELGTSVGERETAEDQFEQRHNERKAAVCLIRTTQDRSLKRRFLRGTRRLPGMWATTQELLAGFLAHS